MRWSSGKATVFKGWLLSAEALNGAIVDVVEVILQRWEVILQRCDAKPMRKQHSLPGQKRSKFKCRNGKSLANVDTLQRTSTNRQKAFLNDLGISHGCSRTLLCSIVSHVWYLCTACFLSGYANAHSLCKTSWMMSSSEPAQVHPSSVFVFLVDLFDEWIEGQSWKEYRWWLGGC